MNWDAIGAIGEILGAFAVVASLIYLAVQVRQQNAEYRIYSAHVVTTAFREVVSSIQDPAVAQLVIQTRDGLEGLADAEVLQIVALSQSYFRVWEEAHYHHSEGRLDPSMWHAMCMQFGGIMHFRWFSESWAIRKNTFREDFQNFVDNERDLTIENPFQNTLKD
jgi:hypothetical protein